MLQQRDNLAKGSDSLLDGGIPHHEMIDTSVQTGEFVLPGVALRLLEDFARLLPEAVQYFEQALMETCRKLQPACDELHHHEETPDSRTETLALNYDPAIGDPVGMFEGRLAKVRGHTQGLLSGFRTLAMFTDKITREGGDLDYKYDQLFFGGVVFSSDLPDGPHSYEGFDE
ncbi:unnamed protein product [Prorocentrum cordatum]|uniref:Uncharacterized protein n=1 Tax=Prorocentrum cordatum TaxID=2364126 RepID=A0ABN9XFM2_9DINO|nr:unnamed protein product [Polarella glacialis]